MSAIGNALKDKFLKFLTTPVGEAARVFSGLFVGYAYSSYQKAGLSALSVGNIQTWVAGSLAVFLPVVIAIINPKDNRFGIKETPPQS